ncbi:MAG: penicillin acylase family protein [Halorientalis sp.]
MDGEQTRRAVLAAILGGGVAGALGTDARSLLDRFAPGSGSVWDTAGRSLPGEVTSPHGTATLRYDDLGVPHVEAETERALAFAVGYAQGADRLAQMDLQRRQMRGELSAVVGERTLSSDRFHVKMDFAGAAEATWDRLEGSETGAVVEAFAEGVNRHLDGPLPMEFDLLGYEPDPWRPADSMLAEKQISWGLTGSFRVLRKDTVAAALGPDVADQLMPNRLDHDAAILGHDHVGTGADTSGDASTAADSDGLATHQSPSRETARETHPDLAAWLSSFESPTGVGSNSWLVSGEYTASGAPILANDPHLPLMAPPVWYELHCSGPDTEVRGVTFPGVPFVVIGENEGGAWGFTNAGADVMDLYEYETRDGQYRYGEEWRDFETETRTVAVAGGDDREVEVRKTVHGPVLGVEGDGDELRTEVAVAWTGLGATRTTEAVRDLNRSSDAAEAREAFRTFDIPTQNAVYADREGETFYRVVGKVPVRRTDGEQVAGTRVFDGSAREGEWAGYTPYGETDWEGEGFIPFAEMPAVANPPYLGTANQRVVDDADYPYYFAEAYSPAYRGIRLWNRLDERAASDDPMDREFMESLQRDAYDRRAEQFVPTMLDARGSLEGTDGLLDDLAAWDYRLTRDSRGALVFARFVHHYRDAVFRPRLADALGDRRDVTEYYGSDWVLLSLPPDSAWFPEGRPAAIETALSATANELEAEGWETYGDYNVTAIDHPFDRSWLNYPRYPTDGGETTLNNFRKESAVGSSWRQISPMGDDDSSAAFPGGNIGSPFSEHYADQLRAWADGEYRDLTLAHAGDVAVRFRGEDG